MAAAAGSGCAPYQAPRLDVAAVTAAQESPQGLVLSFALDAENVNDVPLPLREVRYSVTLTEETGAARTFSGVRSPEATLRPRGVQRVFLPVALPLGEGADSDRPTGRVAYRLSATVYYVTPGALADVLFDTGVRRPRARFEERGEIDLGAGAGAPAQLVAGETR